MKCILCSKLVEGEDVSFDLFDGFVLYQRQKPNSTHREIAHNCKTPRYYERRRQSMRASKLDKALKRFILTPTRAAREELDRLTYDHLLSVAKSGSTMDSIRAAERLIELFVGPEPEPEALPEQTPQRDIHVVVRERFPMADPIRVGEPLAHDRADGQEAIQQVDPAINSLSSLTGIIDTLMKKTVLLTITKVWNANARGSARITGIWRSRPGRTPAQRSGPGVC